MMISISIIIITNSSLKGQRHHSKSNIKKIIIISFGSLKENFTNSNIKTILFNNNLLNHFFLLKSKCRFFSDLIKLMCTECNLSLYIINNIIMKLFMLLVQHPMQFSGPPRYINNHVQHRFAQANGGQLTQLGLHFTHYSFLLNITGMVTSW